MLNFCFEILKIVFSSFSIFAENFEDNLLSEDLSIIAFRIQSGHNQNEIVLVPKSTKKSVFFEKFFQLFS